MNKNLIYIVEDEPSIAQTRIGALKKKTRIMKLLNHNIQNPTKNIFITKNSPHIASYFAVDRIWLAALF
ncbi:MAG: hypothetical protein KDI30_04405 [Pseudomonadales bacterium]|nr:hypothetical protein [Pseudomonadales bacterium]